MDVGKTNEHHVQDVSTPSEVIPTWQRLQPDDQRQHVDLANEDDEEAVVDLFRDPCPEDQLEDE